MELNTRISPPEGVADSEEARRAAETFVVVYQVTLIQVEEYLEDIIAEAGPNYSKGYIPWLNSVRELARGTLLLSKKAPLQHKEAFIDALRLFSFSGASQFIADICNSREIEKDRHWQEDFQDQIGTLCKAIKVA